MSLNLYTHCQDDPVNAYDPSGHENERGDGLGAGAFGGYPGYPMLEEPRVNTEQVSEVGSGLKSTTKVASNPTGRLNMAEKTLNGVKFDADGFPTFKSKYNMNLKPADYLKSRGTHFNRASKSLYNDLLNDPKLASKFTKNKLRFSNQGEYLSNLHGTTIKNQV